jgi:hypothetical protein
MQYFQTVGFDLEKVFEPRHFFARMNFGGQREPPGGVRLDFFKQGGHPLGD